MSNRFEAKEVHTVTDSDGSPQTVTTHDLWEVTRFMNGKRPLTIVMHAVEVHTEQATAGADAPLSVEEGEE